MLESMMRFAPPPRRVPLSLSLTSTLNLVAQIGWALLGFGSIFFWAFVMNADYAFLTFRGEVARAPGRVTSVEKTSASENRQLIHANYYEYSVAGTLLRGVSYSTGRAVDNGDRVTVEYTAAHPERSRIAGMRQKMFGAGVTFVVIFPFIGLLLALFAMAYGARRARLLRDGIFGTGTLKSKRATNSRVNNRMVFELTFEFVARDGRTHQAKARTSMPERLEDERQEPLLYDPDKPEDAVLLDESSSRPSFNEQGELRGRPAKALISSLLPAIVIAGNALALLAKLH